MTSKANEVEKILIELIRINLPSRILLTDYDYEPLKELIKALTDKFHIIPKTDSPEEHVEMPCSWCPQGIDRKLKWKEDKQ